MLPIGLFLVLGCTETPRAKRSGQAMAAAGQAAVPPAAGAPVKANAQQDVPVRASPVAVSPKEPEAPKLDPSIVPVEEDFRAEVERRIDQRTNLEHELSRVAREIAKRQ
jgi:hypothetical protein